MKSKDTVVFTNWFDVNQIPNTTDPHMRVSSTGVYDERAHKLEGYVLTVIWEDFPLQPRIVYRVNVEDARDNAWSLTSEEAVKFLNKIGFICEFAPKEKPLSQEVVDTLKALQTFGYTHICRGKDPKLQLLVEAWSSKEGYSTSVYLLSNSPNYNYEDWVFLPLGIPQIIEGVLNNHIVKGEEEEGGNNE